MMTLGVRSAVLALVLWLCLSATTFAADSRAEGSTVWVNRVKTVSFQASGSGLGPRGRATTLANRLKSGATWPVSAKVAKRSAKIFVGGRALLSVSRLDARMAGTSIGNLAGRWASQLRSALGLPPVKVNRESVLMPVGKSTDIRVVGSKARYAQYSVEPVGAVQVTPTSTGFRVKPMIPGDAVVNVVAGSSRSAVAVDARPYASVFPQHVETTVTGAPSDEWIVRGALEGALNSQLKGERGVRWSFDMSTIRSVPSGQERRVTIPVVASAPDAFPVRGLVTATVKNRSVGGMRETELWYCNDPENVKRFGPLFAAELKLSVSARLLYHHINATSQPIVLRVQVVNDSDQPATLAVTPGDGDPSKNPVLAGYLAGDRFVRSWVTGSGEIIVIPPKSVMPLSIRRLGPGETSSGLCTLRLVDGPDRLLVRTDSIPIFDADARWLAALASTAPWREVGTRPMVSADSATDIFTRHIYPNPFREETTNYEVGGRHRFVRIGQKPISSEDQEGRLDGNFGVVYQVEAKVDNPTETPSEVEVVFEASAGYTGGLFFVDGRYVKTPLLQPKGETAIARFRVAAKGTKTVRILTVPLSGGSYPVTLTVRSVSNITQVPAAPGVTRK